MRIAFFAAGETLRHFMEESEFVKYIEIVGVFDNAAEKWGDDFHGFTIQPPEKLNQVDYDKIAISAYYDEIMPELVSKYNIDEKAIMRIEDIIVPKLCDWGTLSLRCDYNKVYDFRDLIDEQQIITSNRFEEYVFKKSHRNVHKVLHYFEIYEKFFSGYLGRPIRMLEIGVQNGGSTQMWKDYFAEGSLIVGIDIDSKCKQLEEDGISICIGSQADPDFLRSVNAEYGPFDIILDDGSHINEHQIITFESLFPLLADGGIYMCEDTHTSYWKLFGGGLYDQASYVEYSKYLIDVVNYGNIGIASRGHATEDRMLLKLKQFQGLVKSVHFYDSVVVVEKNKKGVYFDFTI
jgi:hypothetical protein